MTELARDQRLDPYALHRLSPLGDALHLTIKGAFLAIGVLGGETGGSTRLAM